MTELDPKVTQRYRELGAEEPPRALDDTILAAARRDADSHPAPLVAPVGRRRWYLPLAAAAVIVLSVAVTLQVQREQPDPEAPAPAPAKPFTGKPARQAEPQLGSPRDAPQRRAAPKVEQARPAEPKPFVPDPAAAAPSPSPQPAAATAMKPMAVQRSDDAMRDRAARSITGEMAEKRMEQAAETPERWLERIAELRRQGRQDEADKALAEFRKRYADYKIPASMLERVERR